MIGKRNYQRNQSHGQGKKDSHDRSEMGILLISPCIKKYSKYMNYV